MNILTLEQRTELFSTLKTRFTKHMQRHEGLEWSLVLAALEKPENESKLWSLYEMERTGGEPDVIAASKETETITFYDCAAESPKGRRSLCYDRAALDARKEYKPENSVVDMAEEMGISLLTEDDYRFLQQFGTFDAKTSSWVKTPESIRKHGGAIFCDYRYGQVFTYHNGADSYYASRGFRGLLTF